MYAGIKFASIKIENKLICDGHHRYIAFILANYPIEIITETITKATTAIDWESVSFKLEDWDTTAKINMLNEQDAFFNDVSVEKIIELLK